MYKSFFRACHSQKWIDLRQIRSKVISLL